MNRLAPLLLALTWLPFLGAPAAAAPQEGFGGFGDPFGKSDAKAQATLYSRIEGDRVRVAIEFAIDDGWHLYHAELGHPEAIGVPTTIELSGAGIEWGEFVWPEPEPLDQSVFGEGVFILSHEGVIVVRAEGVLAEGATGTDIAATIVGQTCDDALCLNYKETVSSAGSGPDELFAAAEVAPPTPEDDHRGGKADAELFVRRDASRLEAALRIRIDPCWHLYHDELGHPDATGRPTVVELSAENVEWGPVRFPEPHEYDQSDLTPGAFILGHEGEVVLRATGRLTDGADAPGPVSAVLSGLTCQDDGTCVLYNETVYDRGEGEDAWFEAAEARSKGEPLAADAEEDDDLWAFLGLAVFWGLFTLLMPCTYPMIPITISFFTKQASDRKGSVLPLSLAYGFGIVAIFVLIGVAFGSVIIDFATHPITNIVIGVLFLYFALVLFGVVNLQPPRVLLELAGKASTTGGIVGVFLMGATLVITSFTCTAPFVGSLLSVGAQGGDLGRIALGMAVFGLTMAIPFVILSLVPGYLKTIPQSGEWMNTLKVFLGFVELAAALKFLSNADLVQDWNIISREFFLLAWALIFLAAGVFLIGLWPGKRAKTGKGRAIAAVATFAFAGYCALGMKGRELDDVMTAIAPNYSGGLLMPNWTSFEGVTTIVVDDYDGAVDVAQDENKLLLVNFTGHT